MAIMKSIRAELSDTESNEIYSKVIRNTLSPEEAATKLGITPDEVRKFAEEFRQRYGTGGYGNDIQKLISYKGTIREMQLQAKNKKGGTYPLKVVNIYIKPNSERYYEEGVYSVDKDAIRTGTEDQGYHPSAALWSNKPKPTFKTKTADIELRRKKRVKTVAKRRKTAKPLRRK